MDNATAIPFQIQINGHGAMVFVTTDSGIKSPIIAQILERLMQKYRTPEVIYTIKELSLGERYSDKSQVAQLEPKATVDELEVQLEKIFKQILSL